MYRNTRFAARFSKEDQDLLVLVAACLQRTKSDTVRILIYEKAAELDLLPNYSVCFDQGRKGQQD